MNNIRATASLNEQELSHGIVGGDPASWHAPYAQCAWVFVGGLAPALSEGDVIAVLSQVGEVEEVVLVRDARTGASRGFAFLKFADARSAVLAVDNFNGAVLLGNTLRVEHKPGYSPPAPAESAPPAAAAAAAVAAAAAAQPPSRHTIELGHAVFAAKGEGGGEGPRRAFIDERPPAAAALSISLAAPPPPPPPPPPPQLAAKQLAAAAAAPSRVDDGARRRRRSRSRSPREGRGEGGRRRHRSRSRSRSGERRRHHHRDHRRDDDGSRR